MTPELTLAVIFLAPVLLLTLFKINAATVFLSLCLGSVLVSYFANSPTVLNFVMAHNAQLSTVGDHTNEILLLLTPVILTMIFMMRTIHGKGHALMNLLPAVGVGFLGALLLVPLLPPGLSHNVIHSTLWPQLLKIQSPVVAASATVCLITIWMQRPKGHKKH